MKKKPKEERMSRPVKIDRSFLCPQHVFFDLRQEQQPAEGAAVWLYCQYCMLTIKKVLVDESDKF